MVISRWQVAPLMQCVLIEWGDTQIRAGRGFIPDNTGQIQNLGHLFDLGCCQLGRGGHRNQTRCQGTQKRDWKINGITQPHQHLLARCQALLQKAARGTQNSRCQLGIAPPFCACRL